MRDIAKILVLSTVVMLTGCSSLLPAKRTSTETAAAANGIEATHDLTVERIMTAPSFFAAPVQRTNLLVTPLGAIETLRVNSRSSIDANANESASSHFKMSIPLGVSLGLAGLGLLMLVYGIRAARSASPAVDAAIEAGDQAVANVIRIARTHFSGPHGDLAKDLVASAEAERGKLARK